MDLTKIPFYIFRDENPSKKNRNEVRKIKIKRKKKKKEKGWE
jgi:hypothetical protein